MRCEIQTEGGKSTTLAMASTHRLNFKGLDRCRAITNFTSILVGPSGTYFIVSFLKTDDSTQWREVARVPLQVTLDVTIQPELEQAR